MNKNIPSNHPLINFKSVFTSILISAAIFSCKSPGSGPLVKESFDDKQEISQMPGHEHSAQVVTGKADIKIEPCSDCITIGRIITDKKSYSGKTIKVKGVVVKVNEEILNKNWVHIQDGTESGGEYDLTITTGVSVSVGDTVTFEGKITLDKDFGYGYFYSILMEEGTIIKH